MCRSFESRESRIYEFMIRFFISPMNRDAESILRKKGDIDRPTGKTSPEKTEAPRSSVFDTFLRFERGNEEGNQLGKKGSVQLIDRSLRLIFSCANQHRKYFSHISFTLNETVSRTCVFGSHDLTCFSRFAISVCNFDYFRWYGT